MNNRLILCLLALTLTFGCTKDKFTSKPQLFFKGVNTAVLPNNSILTFSLQFTDKEGDLSDTLYILRNSKGCPSVIRDLKYPIPAFPSNAFQDGVFDVNFSYNLGGPFNPNNYPFINICGTKPDTSTFRFWIKDMAGNISDTLNSPPIVFLP